MSSRRTSTEEEEEDEEEELLHIDSTTRKDLKSQTGPLGGGQLLESAYPTTGVCRKSQTIAAK
jgi:hypothetical protein